MLIQSVSVYPRLKFATRKSIVAGLPSEAMQNSLRVRIGPKLKVVAYGAVPDELLHNCIFSALSKIGTSPHD